MPSLCGNLQAIVVAVSSPSLAKIPEPDKCEQSLQSIHSLMFENGSFEPENMGEGKKDVGMKVGFSLYFMGENHLLWTPIRKSKV